MCDLKMFSENIYPKRRPTNNPKINFRKMFILKGDWQMLPKYFPSLPKYFQKNVYSKRRLVNAPKILPETYLPVVTNVILKSMINCLSPSLFMESIVSVLRWKVI